MSPALFSLCLMGKSALTWIEGPCVQGLNFCFLCIWKILANSNSQQCLLI